MLLSTAILVGLLGSFHCLGMCAPITWAVPESASSRWKWLGSKMTYNLGRVITYSLLGAVVGLAGEILSFSGLQQGLSIFAGIVLLIGAFLIQRSSFEFPIFRPLGQLVIWVKKKMTRLIMAKGWKSKLSLGLINGLLPCGLVYVALVAAVSMGNVLGGAAYMALFGLGTIPMMLAAAIFGKVIGQKYKVRIAGMIPKFIVLLGVVFILRGLNLGIPYLSPRLSMHQEIIECSIDTYGTSFVSIPED